METQYYKWQILVNYILQKFGHMRLRYKELNLKVYSVEWEGWWSNMKLKNKQELNYIKLQNIKNKLNQGTEIPF